MRGKVPLTLSEVADVLADRPYFNDKLSRRIFSELGKWVRVDEVEDIISDVTIRVLEKVKARKVRFESISAVQAYACQSAWWNYRDSQINRTQYLANQQVDQRDFMQEGTQHAPPSAQRKLRFKSLDELKVEPVAPPAIDGELVEKLDDYFTFLYKLLWTWLDDSVGDGEFTFLEISLYKVYILNRWSVKKVAADSGYSLSTCHNAITKIKRAVAAVDWQMKKQVSRFNQRGTDENL